jgi:chemotaxis protein methyltransferase CheR
MLTDQTTTAAKLAHISEKQMTQFAALIYDVAGIRISHQKRTMLSNRLRRRLRANHLDGFDDYLEFLRTLPDSHAEWDGFLQEVSTHETFLFRDEAQWTWLSTEFLPEIMQQARQGKRGKALRVWSAACSTGDEAYTIAVSIAATVPDAERWSIEIVGTDIGIVTVKDAERAHFGERAMRLVPAAYVRKYFDKTPDDKFWQPKQAIRKWITFRQHNLLEPLDEAPFDLVFLKNVLIYFDVKSKQQALSHVLPLVTPGGVLVTAAAEGVATLIKGLEKQKPWLYVKPLKSSPGHASRT